MHLWPASANCGKSHSDAGSREERTRLLQACNLLINLSDNIFQRHGRQYKPASTQAVQASPSRFGLASDQESQAGNNQHRFNDHNKDSLWKAIDDTFAQE